MVDFNKMTIKSQEAVAAAHTFDPRLDLRPRRRLESEEQVLGGDVVVLELRPLVVRPVEHLGERCGDVRLLLAALHGRPLRQLLLGLGAQSLPVREQRLVEQRQEQVLGVELGIAAAARKLLRSRDRLL